MSDNGLVMVLTFVIFLTVLLTAALVYACKRIERLEELNREETIGDATGVYEVVHAKCIAHIASYVGNEFAAQVLTVAAEDYSSAEGQAEIRELANTKYAPEGPSIPALWLLDRAEGFRDAR